MPKRRLKTKEKWSKRGPNLTDYLEEKTLRMQKYLTIDSSQELKYSIGRIVVVFEIPSNEYLTANILYFYPAKYGEEILLIWEKVDEANEKKVECIHGRWKIISDDEIRLLDPLTSVFNVFGDYFNLVIDAEKSSKDCMYLDICINSKLFAHLTAASEKVNFSESRLSTYIVLNHLHGFSLEAPEHYRILKEIQKNYSPFHKAIYEKEAEDYELSVEEVYNFILNSYKANIETGEVTHSFLIPKLREYQKQAVNWMLHAERRLDYDLNDLHMFYKEFKTRDGFTFYYHKYRGLFVTERFTKFPMCKGGILADEMGLGKTVEVLACILLNPRKDVDATKKPGLWEQNLDVGNYKSGSLPLSDGNLLPTSSGKRLSQSNTKNRKKKNQISPDDKNTVYDQDYNFQENLECVCGKKYNFDNLLQCSKCGLKQHATCVLAQPNVSDVDYLCPYCCVDSSMKPVKSRSTLIVSPSVILSQWNQEIEQHIEKGKLKVFQYLGIDHHKFINPVDLADHDIVLSSYEIFRKELSHINVPHGETQRSLRHDKIFRTLPSPLLAVEWWRICLDEAQMVESITSKTAQMAAEVPSINRWCVTGTPLQKSLEDLHGLIYFLGLDPYYVKEWWSELITSATKSGNYAHLHSILNSVMWRTSKNSVLNQINIPKQETIVHYVNFEEVEKVFYNDLHNVCQKEFSLRFGYMADIDLRLLHLTDLKRLLTPLRNLQKACCHFQLTGGKFSDIQKKKMTIDELHDFLVKKAKYEAEEVNRSLISSLNGLAGCFAIKGDYVKSCKTYKNTLKSVAETDVHIRTDALQQIHTNHNFEKIATILYAESENLDEVKETLGTEDIHSFIEGLNVKYNTLCENYLQKFHEQISTCKNLVFDVNEQILKIKSQFKCKRKTLTTSMWWINILESLNDPEKEVFIHRIKELLMSAPGKYIVSGKVSISDNFNDATGLRYQLVTLADQLEEARLSARQAVDCCFSTSVESVLNSAVLCHLRPGLGKSKEAKKARCLYCQADFELQQYESKLFRFDDAKTFESSKRKRRGKIESNAEDSSEDRNPSRRGCHADSELEIILKEFLHYNGPYFEGKPICMEDGENERQFFLAMKSEFKVLKFAWEKIYNYVSALDELEMTKMAMCLQTPDDKEASLANVVKPEQLELKLAEFEFGIKEDEVELKKKLRHLAYMQNLKKKKDLSEEFCNICREEFGDSWRVLQCGHSFCVPCIHQLCSLQNEQKFPCPVCRKVTTITNIYYANKCQTSETDSSKDSFKGYYSAKVSSVVTCLRNIEEEDPTAKTIVFSSFPGLLDILAESLKDNNIYFASIKDKKSFDLKSNKIKLFEIFKQNPRVNVLLIPLQMGANGINIIEATHVILVEPVMDYSSVLQAIGRVHRIGQTKQTYVHKFVMKNTIEEKIYEIYDKSVSNSDGIVTPVFVKDLMKLFGEKK